MSECDPLSSHSLRCSHGTMSSTNRAPTASHRGRPCGELPGEHPLGVGLGDHRHGVVHPARCPHRGAVVVGGARGDPVDHRGHERRRAPRSRRRAPGSTAAASSPTTRATIAPLSGTLSQGTTATPGGPRARRTASPSTSLPGAVTDVGVGAALAQGGDVRARPPDRRGPGRRPRPAGSPPRSRWWSPGPAPVGRSSAASRPDRPRPRRSADTTSQRSPSAARTTSVYSPSWAARSRATAPRRPANAAMPHSSASGACSVYQAWWARKKLPGPRWAIRTGAAGLLRRRRRRVPVTA